MLGIIFTFIALFCWAFGDFFIQKTSRILGIWKALFFICFIGTVMLSPFAYKDIPLLFSSPFALQLLMLTFVVTLFAALFEFEGLKEGKLAVIEPILGIELPLTVGLSLVLLKEKISLLQSVLIFVIFIGIVLAVTTRFSHLHYHKRILEKGVIIALVGTIAMALTNFLTGVSSLETAPLFTIWFMHLLITISCALYLLLKGKLSELAKDFKRHAKPILQVSILDNIVWSAYALAMTLIPISIATAISESYIALTVLLGVYVNKEKVKSHQMLGVCLAVLGVIALAVVTG